MIFSPNGAALIFTVACSNLFRSAPLGLFVLEIPKPRALPWADLWLARWAGTQTELHSNATYWAASEESSEGDLLTQRRNGRVAYLKGCRKHL